MSVVAVAPEGKVAGNAPDFKDLGAPKFIPQPAAHPVVGNAPAAVSPDMDLAGATLTPVKSKCAVSGKEDEK